MQQFYENLKSGLVKSKALQEAKLSYLRSHKGLLESQPYYWSGIVILGDNEALVPTSKWLKYTWWLLGLGLLAILAYFNLRKKRSARSA
jgi:hypothetical protein